MPAQSEGEALVTEFQNRLRSNSDSALLVRELILHGECAAIDAGQHFAVKQAIADQFRLNVNRDLFVVGSAKLGFSISPLKRYQPFRDTSDIDVAIVSHDLFELVWHMAHEYSRSGADWVDQDSFKNYLAWGWIRPDKLPRSPQFTFRNEWWEFFRTQHRARVCGPYKISAAIYHDMTFLERYQGNAVDGCR